MSKHKLIFVLNRKHGFCLSCNYCQYEYEWQMLSLKLKLSLCSLALVRMAKTPKMTFVEKWFMSK